MRLSTTKQFIVIFINLFLFLFLSIFRDDLSRLDKIIYSWLTAHQSPIIFSTMEGLANIGSGEMILFAVLIITIILSTKRLWKYVIFTLTVTFGGMFISLLLKMTFQRGRPGEARDLEVFGYSLDITSYSFPSGHTMRIVLLAFVLVLLWNRLIKLETLKVTGTCVLIAIPVLVAASRIMSGAHFFTDIMAAVFISIAWFQLCYLFFSKKFLFDKESGFY